MRLNTREKAAGGGRVLGWRAEAAGGGGGGRLPFVVGQKTACNLTWTLTGEATALKPHTRITQSRSPLSYSACRAPFNERTIAPKKTKRLSGCCECYAFFRGLEILAVFYMPRGRGGCCSNDLLWGTVLPAMCSHLASRENCMSDLPATCLS